MSRSHYPCDTPPLMQACVHDLRLNSSIVWLPPKPSATAPSAAHSDTHTHTHSHTHSHTHTRACVCVTACVCVHAQLPTYRGPHSRIHTTCTHVRRLNSPSVWFHPRPNATATSAAANVASMGCVAVVTAADLDADPKYFAAPGALPGRRMTSKASSLAAPCAQWVASKAEGRGAVASVVSAMGSGLCGKGR